MNDTYNITNIAAPDSGLADSGRRVNFDTGGQREMLPGKGRPILLSPMVLRRLAQHMEAGAIKYDERNWEKGLPLSSFIDSAQRHLLDLQEGLTDEDHAVAALWNMHCFIHTAIMIGRGKLPEYLDDMPDYTNELEAIDE
jgi:hypothetical protein